MVGSVGVTGVMAFWCAGQISSLGSLGVAEPSSTFNRYSWSLALISLNSARFQSSTATCFTLSLGQYWVAMCFPSVQ